MSKAYTSNLTQAQFELIEPLIPPAKPGGRPRSVDMWAILNAIFYVVVQGCKWRDIPGDLPPWSTAYTYFRNWRKDGTWVRIHDRIRGWARANEGRVESPSETIIDSQSVKTTTMASSEVGYDGGKRVKGRKRHLSVDTLGLVLRVHVTAANASEQTEGKQLLHQVKQMGGQVKRLYLVWADGGYDAQPLIRWMMDSLGLILQIVLRPQEAKGFVLLKKRWVVERTFGWFNWSRRLSKDYEHLPDSSEAMVYLSMIRLMLRRLA